MCGSGGQVFDYQQPVGGDAVNQPGAGFVAAIKSWQINVIRLTTNEDCWLGINGLPGGGLTATAYQTAIVNFVNLMNSNGIAVIITLQWTQPSTGIPSFNFDPMPDADHAGTYWTSVATKFKTNSSVIFDLYNEPYPDTWEGGYTTQAWTCLRDGRAACPNSVTNGNASQPGGLQNTPYQAIGMQELVNDIRATGYTGIIQSPGIGFTDVLDQWLAYEPVDTLSPSQIVADWHSYQGQVCANTTCYTTVIAPIAAHNPVISNEIGENDCSHQYIDPLMAFDDSVGVNYLGWQWNTYSCGGSPALISDYTGVPTAFGIGLRDHLLAASGIQTPTPVPVPFFNNGVFPYGINVGSTSSYTANDGTVYLPDQNAVDGSMTEKVDPPQGYNFQPFTTTATIGGTLDPNLYKKGRFGQSGLWIINVPNGTYTVTLSAAPTAPFTSLTPTPGVYTTGEFGQDQTLESIGNSCIWSAYPYPLVSPFESLPNAIQCPDGNQDIYQTPTPLQPNIVNYTVQVFNQMLAVQVAGSFGGGRYTMLNAIKIASNNASNTPTPTPTATPPGAPTSTPTPTLTPTLVGTSTPTPTATPTQTSAGIPGTDGFATGALGSFWSAGINQTGSGSFGVDSIAPNTGSTFDMRFSRNDASASRAGVVASHSFTPPVNNQVFAQAYVSIDGVPAIAATHVAHIFSVSSPIGSGELAYFDAHNTNQLETAVKLRDGTWHTNDVDTISSGVWVGLEIDINTSGSNPVVIFREKRNPGNWNIVDQVTDTSVGSFAAPTSLRIGTWVDPVDTPWAGNLVARFDNIALSNVALP